MICFLLAGIICISSYVYCSDTTTIIPYHPAYFNQVHMLLKNNINTLIPHIPKNDLTTYREKMPNILKAIQNSVTMIKPVGHTNHKEGSFERRILLDNDTVVGLLDFFVQKADNKGYIHIAHTETGYEKYKPDLIEAACAHLKKQKDVKSVLTHVRSNGEDYDQHTDALLRSLQFIKTQNEENAFSVVYFERTF